MGWSPPLCGSSKIICENYQSAEGGIPESVKDLGPTFRSNDIRLNSDGNKAVQKSFFKEKMGHITGRIP
jgi:hypothetical protein